MDVLFFGLSLRNPFHSDDFPLTPLIGPIAYLLYSGPALVSVHILLTVGELLKFGASKDQMIVLSLQAVKAAVITYAYQHHTVHFFMYYFAFSPLNLHFSLLALYVPMTHPERNRTRGRQASSATWRCALASTTRRTRRASRCGCTNGFSLG